MYGYGVQVVNPDDVGKTKPTLLFVKVENGKVELDFNDIKLEDSVVEKLIDGTIWHIVSKDQEAKGTVESGSTFYLKNKASGSYLAFNNGKIDVSDSPGKETEWTIFDSSLINAKELEKASKDYVKAADWSSPFNPDQEQGIIKGGEEIFLGNWSFWKEKKNTDKRFFDPHTKALRRSVRLDMRSTPKSIVFVIKEKPESVSSGVVISGSLPKTPTLDEIENDPEVINLISKLNSKETELKMSQQQDASPFEIVGKEKDVKELKSMVANKKYKLFTQKVSVYKTDCLNIIAGQSDINKKNNLKNQFKMEEQKLEEIETKLEKEFFASLTPEPAPKQKLSDAFPESFKQQQAQ